MTRLTNINTYPIKSCAGLRHTAIDVQARGLRGDRRWLIVDPQGRFITGRQFPSLVRVRVAQSDDGIVLCAPGMPSLAVTQPSAEDSVTSIRIWRHDAPARVAADAASEWLERYLGSPCALVYQHDQDRRSIASEIGGQADDHVSFADGYPLLLIGSASLTDLNKRLTAPVLMERFRTNLVADTHAAFVEDSWKSVSIGDVIFDVAKRCSRCIFTTVDPLSGSKDINGEPLKTLRSYRLSKEERGIVFGVNLIPRKTGRIEIGQSIVAN